MKDSTVTRHQPLCHQPLRHQPLGHQPLFVAACSVLAAIVCGTVQAAAPHPAALPAAEVHAAELPTFNHDVAGILFRSCTNCHSTLDAQGGLALDSYAQAKPWAQSIKEAVTKRQMPPWPADPAHSLKFRNDPRLSDRDISTLIDWANAGAPEGNPVDLPAAAPPHDGWLHPAGIPPDAVFSLPEVALPATGEIPYIQRRIKVPYSKDRWIVAMQVRPGSSAAVHHMGITEVGLVNGISLEDLDDFAKASRLMGIPDSAVAQMQPVVRDPQDADAYDMLGVYTPGSTFELYPQGSAKLLKGGGNVFINFNIHYTTTGTPAKDRSQLALWFRSQPPKHQLFRTPAAVATLIANGRELLTDDPGTKAEGTDVAIPPISPYDENYELQGITGYTEPVTIYQLQPHAHMRGKDFKYTVIYPDGRELTVLTVPTYDFHWQMAYELETPLRLPAGAKLVVTAHYDNSSRNAHLRGLGSDLGRNCGPDKQAYFRAQNQSWDEMFSPLVQYSIDRREPAANAGPGKTALSKRPAIAEAVGCLEPGAQHTWTLMNAGPPALSTSQSTSAAALRREAAAALGNRSYALIGADAFNPMLHAGQKIAVIGVLLSGSSGKDGFNVTSLQPVAGGCL